MIFTVYVVLMIVLLICSPWPGSPLANYPYAGHIVYFLLFLCLGLEVFGYGGVRVPLR
jgi:hypothetical protein